MILPAAARPKAISLILFSKIVRSPQGGHSIDQPMVWDIATRPDASPKANQGPKEGVNKPELAKEEENTNPPLKFALKLDPGHSYLKERGLSDEAIENFGRGYCSRGLRGSKSTWFFLISTRPLKKPRKGSSLWWKISSTASGSGNRGLKTWWPLWDPFFPRNRRIP